MKNIRILCALIPTLAVGSTVFALGDQKPAAPEKEQHAEKSKAAELGKPAPDFTLKDVDGKSVKLSDYKGKTVVLEWFNPECPVSAGSPKEGALKDQAARVAKDGVVWLAINSSGEGKEGSGVEKNKK